jgi:Lipopolysaccharide-assembly
MYKKIAGIVFCALLSGCSANYSLTGASIPDYAKSFSVQYFKNQAQLAGPTVAQGFTDALRNYIVSHSSLSLATTGDLDFEGSISGYTIAPLTASSSSPAQSATTRLTITIDVTYTDKKDAKKSFNSSFSRYADFPSSQSITAVQNDLITQIDNQLVQDVFDKAFNNW